MNTEAKMIFIVGDDDEECEQRLQFIIDEPEPQREKVAQVLENIERKILAPKKVETADVFVKNKDSCTSVTIPKTISFSEMERLFADDEKVNIYHVLTECDDVGADDIIFHDGRVGKKINEGDTVKVSDGDFFEVRDADD